MIVFFFSLSAQAVNLPGIAVNFGQGFDLVNTLQVLTLFTILTLAPAILLLCTSFTRIVVVLSFVRQAVGANNVPPNQLLIGLAIFLSMMIMRATALNIYERAIIPYSEKKITTTKALSISEESLRQFMYKQVRLQDIALFYDISGDAQPQSIEQVPLYYLIPSFVISELKSAFQIGFLLYIPFLIVDMVVSSVLMAMGMMMLPPVIVSLPFKLLLFILVDGWYLVSGSLLRSFN